MIYWFLQVLMAIYIAFNFGKNCILDEFEPLKKVLQTFTKPKH